jgi:hypothetical protein
VAVTRDPDKAAARRIEPVADWLQEVEFRRPPGPPPPAWRDRRHWRWMALLAAVVVLALVLFRQPLADLVWPDMRVQRLLDGAESALAQGRLSAADGSGARQQFEAAQALDSDRGEARQGLARVAAAALAQARVQVRENRFDEARQSLALARELQVPRATADALAEQLRQRESARAGIEGMMARAGGNLTILLQHFAHPFEWTHRRISYGVGHRIIGTCPPALRPHKIIFAVLAEHDRTLHVMFRGDLFERGAVWKVQQSCEVRL